MQIEYFLFVCLNMTENSFINQTYLNSFILNLLFLTNKLIRGISLRTIRIEEKVSWEHERITNVRMRLHELIFDLKLINLNFLILQLCLILWILGVWVMRLFGIEYFYQSLKQLEIYFLVLLNFFRKVTAIEQII